MKKINLFILFAFALMSLAVVEGYGQTIHRSFNPRFRIEIPKDWTIQKPKGPNTKLVISDKSGSNINIVVHQDNNFTNYDSYDLTLAELTKDLKQLPDFKILSFEKTNINSRKAICLKSQHRWQNLDIDTILISLMYVIIHNDKMYYITCAGDQGNFSKYEVLFKKTVSTFVIEEDFFDAKKSTPNPDNYKSLKDNFSVDFKGIPNIDTADNMTTYSVTSIKDTAIYRITVHTDNSYISNSVKRKEYEIEFLNEYIKNLTNSGIPYEVTTYKIKSAVLYYMQAILYGDVLFLGEKAYNKSIIFIHTNKVYTLSVTSKQTYLDHLFKSFTQTFEFIY